MSIRKSHLPAIDEIKKQYVLLGHNEFYDRWVKTEVFMGPQKSVEFVMSILEEGKKAIVKIQ
jgi:hypothetical protein